VTAEFVEDRVGEVESVHGHAPGQQAPPSQCRLQFGGECGLASPRRPGDADDGATGLGLLRQPHGGVDEPVQEVGCRAGEPWGRARVSVHGPIVPLAPVVWPGARP